MRAEYDQENAAHDDEGDAKVRIRLNLLVKDEATEKDLAEELNGSQAGEKALGSELERTKGHACAECEQGEACDPLRHCGHAWPGFQRDEHPFVNRQLHDIRAYIVQLRGARSAHGQAHREAK
jgi:hypothetical protein